MNEPAIIEQPGTELVTPAKSKTEIVLIEGKTLAQVFEPNGLDPLIVSVREKALEAVKGFDISDDKGRQAISRAERAVASSKRFVDEGRVALVRAEKDRLKAIDQEGARAWDAFEVIQKDIRAPLTEWELEQKYRVEIHNAAIHDIMKLCEIGSSASIEQLQERLDKIPEFESRKWEEFKQKAAVTIEQARAFLQKRIDSVKAAEAERLAEEQRKLAEQIQKRKEREERIKAEAAAKATRDAEEKAEAERLAVEAAVNREREAADLARLKAETAAQRAAETAERERQARVAAEIEATRQAELAEAAKKAAKAKAKREQEAAVQRERDRQEAVREAALKELADRAANQRIVDAVKRRAIEEFTKLFQTVPADAAPTADWMAEMVVEAIADLKIPNVTINY